MLGDFNIKNSVSIVLIISATLISIPIVCNACVTNADCRNDINFGDFSKCKNGTCLCLDFFALSASSGCIYTVPYGEQCSENVQCTGGPAGPKSFCNSTTERCECEGSTTTTKIVVSKERCTIVRGLGQNCTEDGQCMAGINDFARCNDMTCGCLSALTQENGMCELKRTTPVNISVAAATIAGSVALLVLIVVIYRLTNPNNRAPISKIESLDQVQRRVSIQPIVLPGSSSTKVEIQQ